jgi:hypothetical protein
MTRRSCTEVFSGWIRGETPSISQLNPPSARLFPDASGGAVKGVGAYTAEVSGSNLLRSCGGLPLARGPGNG